MWKIAKKVIYIVSGLLVALLIALGIWLNNSKSLAQGLSLLNKFMPHLIEATGANGSLYSGGTIEHLKVNLDSLTIEASDIVVDWNLLNALFSKISINSIQATELNLIFKLDPLPAEKSKTDANGTVPNNLFIPVFLDINNIDIKVAKLVKLPGGDLAINNLAGKVSYDGFSWQFNLDQLAAKYQNYQAKGSINTVLQARTPFKLAGAVNLDINKYNTANRFNYHFDAKLNHTLPEIELTANLTKLSTQRAVLTVDSSLAIWSLTNPLKSIQAKLDKLNLSELIDAFPPTSLSGAVTLTSQSATNLSVKLHNALMETDSSMLPIKSLDLKTTLAPNWRDYNIAKFNLQLAQNGYVDLAGKIRLLAFEHNWREILFGSFFDIKAKFNNFDPSAFNPEWYISSFDGDIQLNSTKQHILLGVDLAPHNDEQAYPIYAKVKATINPTQVIISQLESSLNTATLTGNGKILLPDYDFTGQFNLVAPGLSANLTSNIAAKFGSATLDLAIPQFKDFKQWLAKLPLASQISALDQLNGKLDLHTKIHRGWQNPFIEAQIHARDLELTLVEPEAPLKDYKLTDLAITSKGLLNELATEIKFQLSTPLANWGWHSAGTLNYQAKSNDFKALLTKLDISAQMSDAQHEKLLVNLVRPTAGKWSFHSLEAAAGEFQITSSINQQTNISQLKWQASQLKFNAGGLEKLVSKGEFSNIAWYWIKYLVPQLKNRMSNNSNLFLNAAWELNIDQQFMAKLNLRHAKGNILINNDYLAEMQKNASGQAVHKIIFNDRQNTAQDSILDVVPISINAASLTLDVQNNNLTASANFISSGAGLIDIDFATKFSKHNGAWTVLPNEKITGHLSSNIANLILVNRLVSPVGWQILGKAEAVFDLSGTLAQPLINGRVQGQEISVIAAIHRIGLHKGRLNISVKDNKLTLEELFFAGLGGGSISSKGEFILVDNQPNLNLVTNFEQLNISNFKDRQLNFSGQVETWLNANKLTAKGDLLVNSANIALPESFPQSLDSDVEIVTANSPASPTINESRFQPDVDINLNLGDNFVLSGYGIKTKLVSKLNIQNANNLFKVYGAIHTKNGEFKAYGQWLKIKNGAIVFKGDYANPNLNIVAIRPHLRNVEVGVRVAGNVLSPDIKLYSQPDMPKEEQLAWLMLGKGGASSAEAAILQQAIISAIGGKDYGGGIQSLGIDQISFEAENERSKGSISASKQLTERMYVTYQHSFGDATDTVAVFYNLTNSWTTRLQLGIQSALDFIYTRRFD